ncbi:MAG TPA: uroporphyrinogen-III C-methyltransferase [Burkholderiales bacterium]|nr:uroporphyrinogen-III C-methyltransferase [Burkholderiales bacterium]
MTPDSRPEPAAASAPADPVPPRRGLLARVNGLSAVIVVALVVLVWQWYDSNARVNALQQELARRLAEFDVRSKDSRSVSEQSREAVREFQVKLGALEARLAESQNQQIALEALYQELARNRDEWALTEIEQTLLAASRQLQLAGNLKAALIALQDADLRLQRMERPQLAPLRKVINKDIDRLKLAPNVDVVGISVRLDNLMAAVDTLPLAMELRPPPEKVAAPAQAPESGTLARLARETWQDLKQLVRVQNVDKPDVPLLAPSQAFFLRENLKLRLLSARMALIARDAASYKADLKAARDWIARYYDSRDKSIANVAASLKQLAESPVSIELPDISASLDAVRNYKLTREKGR